MYIESHAFLHSRTSKKKTNYLALFFIQSYPAPKTKLINTQLLHSLTRTPPNIPLRSSTNILPLLSLRLRRGGGRSASSAGVFAALVLLDLLLLLLRLFGGVCVFFDLLPFGGGGEFVLDWVEEAAEGGVYGGFELG